MSSYVENQLKLYKKKFNSSVRFLPINEKYNIPYNKSKIKLEMNYKTDDKLILFFGLIRPYKGLDNLLHAFNDVLLNDHSIKLVIAGEAYEKLDRYKKIINKYDMHNNIIWIDEFLSNQFIEKLMIISDLLILPYDIILEYIYNY